MWHSLRQRSFKSPPNSNGIHTSVLGSATTSKARALIVGSGSSTAGTGGGAGARPGPNGCDAVPNVSGKRACRRPLVLVLGCRPHEGHV